MNIQLIYYNDIDFILFHCVNNTLSRLTNINNIWENVTS